jgi:hypothetical protein
MAKSNKHNARAKKVKARKSKQGTSRNFVSLGPTIFQKFAQADRAGADSIIDLDSPNPGVYFKENGQWVKQILNF